jgi:hypothetical protein
MKKMVVVSRTIPFEVGAEVEEGRREDALRAQEEHN